MELSDILTFLSIFPFQLPRLSERDQFTRERRMVVTGFGNFHATVSGALGGVQNSAAMGLMMQ
jgi:hypothetical protein